MPLVNTVSLKPYNVLWTKKPSVGRHQNIYSCSSTTAQERIITYTKCRAWNSWCSCVCLTRYKSPSYLPLHTHSDIDRAMSTTSSQDVWTRMIPLQYLTSTNYCQSATMITLLLLKWRTVRGFQVSVSSKDSSEPFMISRLMDTSISE